MPHTTPCCCCPPFAETGLPESLTLTLAVVTDTDTGMPSDAEATTCDGSGAYYRFTHNADLLGSLAGIVFDYVESAAAGCSGATCCYRYTGRLEETVTCDAVVSDVIWAISSPFPAYVYAEYAETYTWTGSGEDPSCGPYGSIPDPACCGTYYSSGGSYYGETTSLTCEAVCGNSTLWTNGTSVSPIAFTCWNAGLLICIEGDMITVCAEIEFRNFCEAYTGEVGAFGAPLTWHAPHIDCVDGALVTIPAETPDLLYASTDCIYSSSTLSLLASADISGVPGATTWDKIKAAEFVSDYEWMQCNCGTPDCSGEQYDYTLDDCIIFCSCVCGGGASGPPTHTLSKPIDIDCYYSAGTMSMTFSDA